MTLSKYILIGRDPVAISDDQLLTWGAWFEHHPRHMANTVIAPKKPLGKGKGRMRRRLNHFRTQRVRVSTIFLALDHNHWGGRPILFETLIFGGFHDGTMRRYYTIDEAFEGHKELVKLLDQPRIVS